MRLWSIHPVYLDARGLTALWREGLLARKVLQGGTKGYKNHPQLERFRSFKDPVAVIDCYLLHVFEEAQRRGYSFDRDKLGVKPEAVKIPVTEGQIKYEIQHLKRKLKLRNAEQYKKIASVDNPHPHPIFDVVAGNVEPWESMVGH
jgi:hypothetical protein